LRPVLVLSQYRAGILLERGTPRISVSVHRVEDITQAQWGTRVSASTVSDLFQTSYRQIE
jgi:hypothetical protein